MPRPPDTTTLASPRSGRALFCVACSATSSAPSASTAPTATVSTAPAAPPAAGDGNAVWRTLATTTLPPTSTSSIALPAYAGRETVRRPATALMSDAMPAPSSAAARGRMSLPVDVAVPSNAPAPARLTASASCGAQVSASGAASLASS